MKKLLELFVNISLNLHACQQLMLKSAIQRKQLFEMKTIFAVYAVKFC